MKKIHTSPRPKPTTEVNFAGSRRRKEKYRRRKLSCCFFFKLFAVTLDNFSRRREVDRISIFKGGLLGDLFPKGRCFYIKNKLKSKIFSDKKKFVNKNVFFGHN